MVAQDAVTAWDLKPNRENVNQVFNVLCNVKPVEHPRSWDWYNRQIDVTTWSKQQYRFEKCEWLKKCTLYHYNCSKSKLIVSEEENDSKYARYEKMRSNANFTDVVLFQWYRIYMRKSNSVLKPYWEYENEYVESWWDWNANTCDQWSRPSDIRKNLWTYKTLTNENDDKANKYYWASDRIRLYIQQVDTKWCTWDTFDSPDESPIILAKEYEAAECNPDHFIMWYGWIWTPRIINDVKISMIIYWWQIFAYLYWTDKAIWETDFVYIKELWVYVSWLTRPTWEWTDILNSLELPTDWYFIPNSAELTQVLLLPTLVDWQSEAERTQKINQIQLYNEYWEIPYFASWSKLYSINWFFHRKDWSCNIPDDNELDDLIYRWWIEDNTPCRATAPDYPEKRVFIMDNVIESATNSDVITWLTRWWSRIAYISWDYLNVSWNWIMAWVFWADMTWANWDIVRWAHILPAGITDCRTLYGSIVLLWPNHIYVLTWEDALKTSTFINTTDNNDWYYSPNSYFNDDWEFLIVRRWKLLETLQYVPNYWTTQFTPDTGFYINWHLKPLNPEFDKISIDATVNHRYICIYDDNDKWDHYSKLLIYDKHYNCWYHRMITWARIVHVKDGIFLWDWVYANKWRTRWWKEKDTEWWEIIEIISAYVWEEWLQTPKHIQYVKTAIWDHSIITNNSYRDIDTSYWWKLFQRRNNITLTRYPRLLTLKNKDTPIETYEIWEQIYWHWRLLSHTLLNEISEYRNYDKFSSTIVREMWEDIDFMSRLAMFASIKEPINAPANVLEISISARHLDNVQFGSFYVWYYQLDADFEDIENTNIDITDAADRTKELNPTLNTWEYCEEVLNGSACDVDTF